MDTSSENFGLRLRSLIEAKKKSIDAFADECGIARSTAHNWLNLEMPPLRKHWPKLSKYFGVSESYLAHGRPTSSVGSTVGEVQAQYGMPASLESDARNHLEIVIAAAKGEPTRLGWIVEQLQEHVAVPAHWRSSRSPLIRVTTPSQTQDLSSETGLPIPAPSRRARSA